MVDARPAQPGPASRLAGWWRRPRRGPGTAVWQWLVFLAGALMVFGAFNLSIVGKERLLQRGAIVRLALAPRDPRDFLTGDYMALNYALATELNRSLADRGASVDEAGDPADGRAATGDGYLVVALDERRVARMVRVQPAAKPLAAGEVALRYRQRQGRVQLGSNAFFFEEGQAARYEAARFGEYRVDSAGAMLLVRLLDQQLDPL